MYNSETKNIGEKQMIAENLEQIALDVVPEVYESLDSDERAFIERLNDYEAPWLEEKLLKDSKFENKDEYQEAFTEFKKYMSLIKLCGSGVAMCSKRIDEVWHQMILFTREYQEFCNELFGEFIHHSPKTSYTPLQPDGAIRFREFYTLTYGKIFPIWGSSNNEECTEPDRCAPEGWCNPTCD